MTTSATQAAIVYRDHVVAGVPASGAKEPDKAEIRALHTQHYLETEVAAGATLPDLAALATEIEGYSTDAITAQGAAEAAQAAAEDAADQAEFIVTTQGEMAHYDTKAALDAALGSHADGDVASVFADETRSSHRTVYRRVTGAWVFKYDYDAAAGIIGVYQTKAEVEAANVPAVVYTILVQAFPTQTCGAMARLARSGSEPAHGGKVQSGDGQWWVFKTDFELYYELFSDGSADISNGTADFYDAYKAAVEYLNAVGAGKIRFKPNRTYAIDQFMITGGGSANSVTRPQFEDLTHLHWDFNGSKLSVRGDYVASADNYIAPFWLTHQRSVNPLFIDIKNLVIENGEIDLNADETIRDYQVSTTAVTGTPTVGDTVLQAVTGASGVIKSTTGGIVIESVAGGTRDQATPMGFDVDNTISCSPSGATFKIATFVGVIEGQNHGLQIAGGHRVIVRNMHIHHCQADGIQLTTGKDIGDGNAVIRQAILENVVCEKNGRMGLSVIGVIDLERRNCRFERTAQDNGVYGGHNPMCGEDIEPDAAPPTNDVKTSARAIDCVTSYNPGAQLLCSVPDRTSIVTYDNHKAESDTANVIITSAEEVTFRGGKFKNIRMAPQGNGGVRYIFNVVGAIFEVTRSDMSVMDIGDDCEGDILDNQFKLNGASAFSGPTPWMMAVEGTKMRFKRNRVFISANLWTSAGTAYTANYASALKFECMEVEGNTWDTDLVGDYWNNAYNGATRVGNNGDPQGRWLYDRALGLPHGKGRFGVGTMVVGGLLDYRNEWLTGNAAPAAGPWRQGDFVKNSTIAVGQPKGWSCTVSGTPGTWVSEGNL